MVPSISCSLDFAHGVTYHKRHSLNFWCSEWQTWNYTGKIYVLDNGVAIAKIAA